MKRTILSVLVALPLAAQAQTYSKTETIEYHDNTTLWVLGQTATVTCVAPAECTPSWAPSGIVMSETAYDTLARPVTVKSFGKLKQTLTYDTTSTVTSGQLGTLKTVKDGNNNITTFGNWKRGIPQAITHADSSTQSAEVNDHGWIKWVMDENGHTTNYEYDVMGRLSRIQYPLNDTVAWLDTTSVFEPVAVAEYGIPAGHWRQTVSTGNARKVTYFDALWRPLLTHEYDAANPTGTLRASSTEYDSDGRVTFQSYPSSDLVPAATGTWSFYDALGRVTQVKQDSELGQQLTTTTEYLAGFQTRVTNPRGQQTLYEYQVFDQPSTDAPTGVTQFAGVDTAATEIQRDVFGKVKRLTRRNADGSLRVDRHYVYQADQLLCKSIEPETGATVYAYDWAGNLTHSASGLV
ncbi:MAG: RHS repeat protein, partial [Pseudoxanthomonas sp.]